MALDTRFPAGMTSLHIKSDKVELIVLKFRRVH